MLLLSSCLSSPCSSTQWWKQRQVQITLCHQGKNCPWEAGIMPRALLTLWQVVFSSARIYPASSINTSSMVIWWTRWDSIPKYLGLYKVFHYCKENGKYPEEGTISFPYVKCLNKLSYNSWWPGITWGLFKNLLSAFSVHYSMSHFLLSVCFIIITPLLTYAWCGRICSHVCLRKQGLDLLTSFQTLLFWIRPGDLK